MTDGNSQMLRSVITAVVTATLISGAGALVAIKVQGVGIEQNASDVSVLEADVRAHNTVSTHVNNRLTKLETSEEGNERRHDENYTRVSRQLTKLQVDINTLLRRSPSRRPR